MTVLLIYLGSGRKHLVELSSKTHLIKDLCAAKLFFPSKEQRSLFFKILHGIILLMQELYIKLLPSRPYESVAYCMDIPLFVVRS